MHLDWQQPWFTTWAPYGEKVLLDWQQNAQHLHQALNRSFLTGSGNQLGEKNNKLQISREALSEDGCVRFVPQQDLPSGTAYETFIFQHKHIPTRNNAHDFFNGLCWLRFPQSKTKLNHMQAQAISIDGVKAQRGALRDALTLFDENAALLSAPPAIWQALQLKQWPELFVLHRDAWQEAKLLLFGHALLEKFLHPYKGITAHVLCIPMPEFQTDEAIDTWLCQQLSDELLKTKPFVPLPLSGIPGWWPANQDPVFFEDKKVFRD